MLTKVCPSCNTEKDISNFGKDKQTKSGYKCHCKSCRSISSKQYVMSLDYELRTEKRRLDYLKNKERDNKRNNEYRLINKERILEVNKLYYLNNKNIYLKHYKN
jgi:hypothetical protein